VPQVAVSGTAKRTFVREPGRSPQDGVLLDSYYRFIIGLKLMPAHVLHSGRGDNAANCRTLSGRRPWPALDGIGFRSVKMPVEFQRPAGEMGFIRFFP